MSQSLCIPPSSFQSNITFNNLVEVATAAFHSDQLLRARALEYINFLQDHQSDYALQLVLLAASQTLDINSRLSLFALLKSYIKSHWSTHSEHSNGTAPTPEIKQTIQHILLDQCLPDSDTRIRTSTADIVSKLARIDWPDEWPQFLPSVIAQLQSHQINAIHGALCVLEDCAYELLRDDLTAQRLPDIFQSILPHLLQIFFSKEEDLPSASTMHYPCVKIFSSCIEVFNYLKKSDLRVNLYPLKTILKPMLPNWITAFISTMELPTVPTPFNELKFHSMVRLKCIISKALDRLILNFLDIMQPYLPTLMVLIWTDLKQLTQLPMSMLQQSMEQHQETSTFSAEKLIYSYFDFFHRVLYKPGSVFGKEFTQPSFLETLVPILLYFMQISEETLEVWQEELEEFLTEEIQNESAYSLRIASLNLMKSLKRFDCATNQFLRDVLIRKLQPPVSPSDTTASTPTSATTANSICTWQEMEVIMKCLTLFEDDIDQPYPLFELILQHPLLQSHSFLKGRFLLFSSEFIRHLTLPQSESMARYALTYLEDPNPNSFLVLCALQMLNKYNASAFELEKSFFQLPLLQVVLNLIPKSSDQFQLFLLDILKTCIASDSQTALSLSQSILQTCLCIWEKSFNDPHLCYEVVHLIQSLISHRQGFDLFLQSFVPTLLNFFTHPLKLPTLLELFLYVFEKGYLTHHAPMTSFLALFYPLFLNTIIHVDDPSILKPSHQLLTFLFTHAFQDLPKEWMPLFLQCLHRHLNTHDTSVTYLGDVIRSFLIQTLGNFDPTLLRELLCVILQKLHWVQDMDALQRFVLIFASLLLRSYEETLQFLLSVSLTPETSFNGLTFVISKWVECHTVMTGSLDVKLSVYLLSEILLSQDPRIINLMVPGEPVDDTSQVTSKRITRSAKRAQATIKEIPLHAKLWQLFAADLVQLESDRGGVADLSFTDDEDGVQEHEAVFSYLCDDMDNEMKNQSEESLCAEFVLDSDPTTQMLMKLNVYDRLVEVFTRLVQENLYNYTEQSSMYLTSDQSLLIDRILRDYRRTSPRKNLM